MTNNKMRAHNLPGSGVGKKRKTLYAAAFNRIDGAIKIGFYLEAICLIESIMADRLEARVAWLTNQTIRKFDNLGPLLNLLQPDKRKTKRRKIVTGLPESDREALKIYKEVNIWRDVRNKAVHEMAKLHETDQPSWEDRYRELHDIAVKGRNVGRRLSTKIRSLNRIGKNK
jgi:hypothetical protein